jgi:hypothetical protein
MTSARASDIRAYMIIVLAEVSAADRTILQQAPDK